MSFLARLLMSSCILLSFSVLGCYSCVRTNMSKGIKRKFSNSGKEKGEKSTTSVSTYSLQRQSMLDMSLIKLQLCHMLVEPNLCRSVLIANTVRQIQDEMTHDGSWLVVTEAFSGATQSPPNCLVALSRLPAREPYAVFKLCSVAGLEDCHEEGVVGEGQDSAEAFTFLLGSTHCRVRRETWALPSEEEDSEDLRLSSKVDDNTEVQSREDLETTVFGMFDIKNGTPGTDLALEELFTDGNASNYNLDTMLTSTQSNPKLLNSLASVQGSSSTSSCRPDLNELDHIMEIIVGS